jgi:hypothetical protein
VVIVGAKLFEMQYIRIKEASIKVSAKHSRSRNLLK